MEDNTPSAPTEASQAPASVETPTTNQPASQPAVDLGLTAEQAEQFKTFMANNGGFDSAFKKLKTDISTPKNAQPAPVEQPTSHTQPEPAQPQPAQPVSQPQYKAPEGSISPQEFLAGQYFKALASEEKYAPIAKGIENGDYLKEMAAFGIKALNQDGSINDQKVRMYLDLKAQTVPAAPTSAEPNMSAAPTVSYVEVGDQITSLDQAYQVIMQPGHPATQKAEEFIKQSLNKS